MVIRRGLFIYFFLIIRACGVDGDTVRGENATNNLPPSRMREINVKINNKKKIIEQERSNAWANRPGVSARNKCLALSLSLRSFPKASSI